MKFEVVGEIENIETIAVGRKIRIVEYLQKAYGRGRWRKLKGIARPGLLMAESDVLSYTGMKHMVSVVRI